MFPWKKTLIISSASRSYSGIKKKKRIVAALNVTAISFHAWQYNRTTFFSVLMHSYLSALWIIDQSKWINKLYVIATWLYCPIVPINFNFLASSMSSLHWHKLHGVSYGWQVNCFSNLLFSLISQKTSKPTLLSLCEENPLVTSGFPS